MVFQWVNGFADRLSRLCQHTAHAYNGNEHENEEMQDVQIEEEVGDQSRIMQDRELQERVRVQAEGGALQDEEQDEEMLVDIPGAFPHSDDGHIQEPENPQLQQQQQQQTIPAPPAARTRLQPADRQALDSSELLGYIREQSLIGVEELARSLQRRQAAELVATERGARIRAERRAARGIEHVAGSEDGDAGPAPEVARNTLRARVLRRRQDVVNQDRLETDPDAALRLVTENMARHEQAAVTAAEASVETEQEEEEGQRSRKRKEREEEEESLDVDTPAPPRHTKRVRFDATTPSAAPVETARDTQASRPARRVSTVRSTRNRGPRPVGGLPFLPEPSEVPGETARERRARRTREMAEAEAQARAEAAEERRKKRERLTASAAGPAASTLAPTIITPAPAAPLPAEHMAAGPVSPQSSTAETHPQLGQGRKRAAEVADLESEQQERLLLLYQRNRFILDTYRQDIQARTRRAMQAEHDAATEALTDRIELLEREREGAWGLAEAEKAWRERAERERDRQVETVQVSTRLDMELMVIETRGVVDSARMDVDAMERERNEAREQAEEALAALGSEREAREEMEANVVELEAEREQLDIQMAELEREMEEAVHSREMAERETAELQERAQALEDVARAEMEARQVLEERLQAAKAEAVELRTTAAAAVDAERRRAAELEALQQQQQERDLDVTINEMRGEEESEELAAARARIAELEQKLEDSEKAKNAFRRQKEEANRQLNLRAGQERETRGAPAGAMAPPQAPPATPSVPQTPGRQLRPRPTQTPRPTPRPTPKGKGTPKPTWKR